MESCGVGVSKVLSSVFIVVGTLTYPESLLSVFFIGFDRYLAFFWVRHRKKIP